MTHITPAEPNPDCTGTIETCERDSGECMTCGERDCPRKEPLHYHHDGCPACVVDLANIAAVAAYDPQGRRRALDSSDGGPFECPFCGVLQSGADTGPGGWDEHWRTCDKNPRFLDQRVEMWSQKYVEAHQLLWVLASSVDGAAATKVEGRDDMLCKMVADRLDYLEGLLAWLGGRLLTECADSGLPTPSQFDAKIGALYAAVANGSERSELLAREVARLKDKCARYATYAQHLEGCKDALHPNGDCDCGLSETLSDVDVGMQAQVDARAEAQAPAEAERLAHDLAVPVERVE